MAESKTIRYAIYTRQSVDKGDGLASEPHNRLLRHVLARLLLKGPRQHGYSTELWILERVAEVIAVNFGVEYHPGHATMQVNLRDTEPISNCSWPAQGFGAHWPYRAESLEFWLGRHSKVPL